MDDDLRTKLEELNIKQVKTDILLNNVETALLKFNKNTEDIIRITEKVKLVDKHEDFLVNGLTNKIIEVSSKEFINYLNKPEVRKSLSDAIDDRIEAFHTKVYNKFLVKAIGWFSLAFSSLMGIFVGIIKWLI